MYKLCKISAAGEQKAAPLSDGRDTEGESTMHAEADLPAVGLETADIPELAEVFRLFDVLHMVVDSLVVVRRLTREVRGSFSCCCAV